MIKNIWSAIQKRNGDIFDSAMRMIEKAFRDGGIKTTGTDIDTIMPF